MNPLEWMVFALVFVAGYIAAKLMLRGNAWQGAALVIAAVVAVWLVLA